MTNVEVAIIAANLAQLIRIECPDPCPRVRVDVGRHEGDERQGERVDDPGDEVEEDERRVRDEEEQRPEQRPGDQRDERAHADERRRADPAAADERAAASERRQGARLLELDDGREQ